MSGDVESGVARCAESEWRESWCCLYDIVWHTLTSKVQENYNTEPATKNRPPNLEVRSFPSIFIDASSAWCCWSTSKPNTKPLSVLSLLLLSSSLCSSCALATATKRRNEAL